MQATFLPKKYWSEEAVALLPRIKALSLPKLQDFSEKCSVLIETRRIEHLETVLRLHFHHLDNSWCARIFCSNDNIDYIEQCINNCGLNIKTILIDSFNTLDQYNKFMLNKWVWEYLQVHERVLFFQDDGFLLKHGIDDFLQYDYIGAPWTKVQVNKNNVGNGGFSLRNPKLCKKLLETYSVEDTTKEYKYDLVGGIVPEDVFFSITMEKIQAVLPTNQIASQFSVETTPYNGSLGWHGLWNGENNWLQTLKNTIYSTIEKKSYYKKNKLAVIYNNYMITQGGGERSTLAYIKALKNLGYDTVIISHVPNPPTEVIVRNFGDEYKDVKLIQVQDPARFCHEQKADIFINHSCDSHVMKPAGIFSIYSLMLPLCPYVGIHAIFSYDLVLCNSSFTLKNTVKTYPQFKDIEVLFPPIDLHSKKIIHKEKKFLHVGRFGVLLHCKNQLIIIENFIKSKIENESLKDWELHIVGNFNENYEPDKKYVEQCLKFGEFRDDIKIHIKINTEELNKLYDSSFAYVHATGAFNRPPRECEHFGLTVMEAASRNCYPLLYNQGGYFDLIKEYVDYSTPDEMKNGFAKVASLYNDSNILERLEKNTEGLKYVTSDYFMEKLKELLRKYK